MRVAAFGSSVGLSVRPPGTSRQEGTYLDLLRMNLQAKNVSSDVFNLMKGSNLITLENNRDFADNIKRYNPDLVILNFGINEAAPRAIPYKLWYKLYSGNQISRFHKWLGKFLYKWSPTIIRVFRKKSWVSVEDFGTRLEELINICRKEVLAEVIVLNIGPANERFMNKLPGVEKYIPIYNQKIGEVVKKCNAELLDIFELVNENGLDKTQPDGCHFSVFGHKLICDKILEMMRIST